MKFNLNLLIYPGSNSLLMGKLIGQGAIRSEVVGSARQQGVGPSEIEEVKVRFSTIHSSKKVNNMNTI